MNSQSRIQHRNGIHQNGTDAILAGTYMAEVKKGSAVFLPFVLYSILLATGLNYVSGLLCLATSCWSSILLYSQSS